MRIIRRTALALALTIVAAGNAWSAQWITLDTPRTRQARQTTVRIVEWIDWTCRHCRSEWETLGAQGIQAIFAEQGMSARIERPYCRSCERAPARIMIHRYPIWASEGDAAERLMVVTERIAGESDDGGEPMIARLESCAFTLGAVETEPWDDATARSLAKRCIGAPDRIDALWTSQWATEAIGDRLEEALRSDLPRAIADHGTPIIVVADRWAITRRSAGTDEPRALWRIAASLAAVALGH